METCKNCLHVEVCREYVMGLAAARGVELDATEIEQVLVSDDCENFKDRSRFVELPVGEWIYGEDYFGYPVYRCSNCKEQLDFEEGTPKSNDYRFCPFCGAKMEDVEQALKEREKNG